MSNTPTAFPSPEDSSNDPKRGDGTSPGRSRLDREVDEILTQTIKSNPLPPIPFKQRVAERRAQMPHPKVANTRWRDFTRIVTAVPLLTSFALAVICAMMADSSPLLARVFAVAAVAVLIYPIVIHVRGGSTPNGPQLWRGQVMDLSETGPSPVDQLKRWIHSRPPK